MRRFFLIASLCLGILSIFSIVIQAQDNPCSVITDVPTSDCEALVALYNSTNGIDWNSNYGWYEAITLQNGDTSLCDWFRITCTNGYVTRVYLISNYLTGTLPPELGNLSNVLYLIFNSNYLTGTIPPELGNLTTLVELDLNRNVRLSEAIPAELGNLSSLEKLDISRSSIWGSIPPELGNLSNLTHLDLSTTFLSGTIPIELGSLTNLRQLNLGNTELTGSIPVEFGNLILLERLDFSRTYINGEIPPELGNLTELRYLILADNNLIGYIPISLTALTKLNTFNVHDARVCNPTEQVIIDWIYSIPNGGFPGLDCENDPIPPPKPIPPPLPYDPCSLITDVPKSECDVLVLFYDQTGSWTYKIGWHEAIIERNQDTSLCDWSRLTCANGHVTRLELSFNGVSGPLLPELGNLTQLEHLDLEGANFFSSPIPPELGNLSNLKYLSLRQSRVSGEIPPELGNLSNLRELNLANNGNLIGTIPPELGNLSNLTYLSFENDNLLTGTIPPELGNLSNLEILIIGSTRSPILEMAISGEIPPELGNLSRLLTLHLEGTNITGVIPPEISNLGNLTSLNLSGTNISGPLPPEIGNLSNLVSLNLSEVLTLDTSLPPEWGNLSNLRWLHLQESLNLSGSIPPEFGNLSSLEYFWAHDTNLSGPLPYELSKISGLDTLRLHNTNLSRHIPTSFVNLREMRIFTLSNTNVCEPLSYSLQQWADDLTLYAPSGLVCPSAPSNLSASETDNDSILLEWADLSGNNENHIERSADNGVTWQEIAQLGVDIATYTDTTIACDVNYRYRVQTYDPLTDLDSHYSRIATIRLSCLEINDLTVSINEGQLATNTGHYAEPSTSLSTLASSIGSIVNHQDGTWSWSYLTQDGPVESQIVTITATYADTMTSQLNFNLNVLNIAPNGLFIVSPENVLLGNTSTAQITNPHDDSPMDTDAGLLYSFDCNGDNIFEQTMSLELSFVCQYTTQGTYTVVGRITDKDGDSSLYSATIAVVTHGNCNADSTVDAGDLSALQLEIFDDDSASILDDIANGFAGNPIGCDANADSIIDAGDLSCVQAMIFDEEFVCGVDP